jgi:hypothetical protein
MGTKLAGDRIGWGPNWLGTNFLGTVCPGGPNCMGTICPEGPINWGPFVQGDRKGGTGSPGTKCVRDQMSLILFLASMGETELSHDIFFKFSLGPFEVVEVE